MLDTLHASVLEPARLLMLGRLFYATDTWLKLAGRKTPGINERRQPAVQAFYVALVNRLSEETGVPINLLPNWLSQTFGKAMHEHGVDLDITKNLAEYLNESQVRKYRLDFRGGFAYQQKWWKNSTGQVLANSLAVTGGSTALGEARGADPAQVIQGGFSGYVMSQGGDFYSGPHFAPLGTDKELARYHSSYYGGEPVLCAGEIKIVAGRVLEINNESGHYRPGPQKLAMAVEMLAMLGVRVRDLTVFAIGQGRVSGDEFLKRWIPQISASTGAETSVRGTPLSEAMVKRTLAQNASAVPRVEAYTLLKQHWRPKPLGHGPFMADKCPACKEKRGYWDMFRAAVEAYGGVDKVPVVAVAPAKVAGH